ncbi:hypothetical protein IWW34DRAFT_873384 [Fusarium oxysporum f. sp. albedinis]|nr:hypothetical protein IWW34DRAFT_873384 [Fusarium oxysporum f. sp. albedinis]KAJ0135876.1 ATP-dependent DNA helicase pif1 [Fusarium oxysporum f. sp. albedinis]KAK2468878.1 hypothetical protein H9L39_19470 [Fusarium oxysporum f. sp. albedinis]
MVAPSPRRIALFGGTGGTGSATVLAFMKRQDFKDSIELRLLVRAKDKLFRLIPDLATLTNVHVCEGQLTDKPTVRDCLRDADTIICAIGENQNIPGVHVIQDIAKSIVDGLRDLQQSCTGQWKKPRLILLSSSTWNDRFASQEPAIALWFLKTAFHHPYLDLRLATAHFEASSELLSLLLVQPSALVDDEPSGVVISTEQVSMAVSYADLGEGFAELAMEDAYRDLKAIGVSSKAGNNPKKYMAELLIRIVWGMLAGYMPGYWTVKKLVG